jgi:hypothetical protein
MGKQADTSRNFLKPHMRSREQNQCCMEQNLALIWGEEHSSLPTSESMRHHPKQHADAQPFHSLQVPAIS